MNYRLWCVSYILLLFVLPGARVGEGAETGVIKQVTGDVAYVSGLNGSAPLWSRLQVVAEPQTAGATLEVIKELDELLVARVISENGVPIHPTDKVIRIAGNGPSEGGVRRVVFATKVDRGPKLDGRLDDSVWQEARPIEGFLQWGPDYWMPGTESTVVQIVYDQDQIYFGFECNALDPKRIVANNMRRDSEISSDDNVQILLDTYNDRQNAFFFFVNPLGARRDLLLSNEGRTNNPDWDCNWEARTRRHAKGWTAEVAIPFDQLRFKKGQEMVWGINLARRTAHKNEEVQVVPSLQGTTSRSRYNTSDLAVLRGLEAVEAKRLFQVKPYVLPGNLKDLQAVDPLANSTFESGIDVRYGITPNITADLSYNTDFAQVEGDQEQVNLTQFRLFFPEKREFFLEGASVFAFGEAAEITGSGTRPPTLLFYSRRIGLEEGKRVPILFGTKLAGKAGRTSVGALNVLTDSEQLPDAVNLYRTNFSVVRVKQDVFARSNIGFMLVNKQVNTPGSGTYNRAGGVDFSFSPTTKLNFQGFIARTRDSALGDTDDARFVRGDYRGSLFEFRARVLDVEDHFEPAVGFVNRRRGLEGFRRYDARTRLRFRPRSNPMRVRYSSIGPGIQVITDRENRLKFRNIRASWWTQFDSADWYRVEVRQVHDVVDEAFEPSRRKDVEIPPGAYTFTTFVTGPRLSRARKLGLIATFEAGTYYTGHLYRCTLEGAYRPSGRFSLETEYDISWIQLPRGNLNIQTLSNRLLYSLTTDFFVKVFAQWNNDRERVSANFLLNYRFRPGSDLFLVYDHGFGTEDGLAEQNRAVLLKLSYLIGL